MKRTEEVELTVLCLVEKDNKFQYVIEEDEWKVILK